MKKNTAAVARIPTANDAEDLSAERLADLIRRTVEHAIAEATANPCTETRRELTRLSALLGDGASTSHDVMERWLGRLEEAEFNCLEKLGAGGPDSRDPAQLAFEKDLIGFPAWLKGLGFKK